MDDLIQLLLVALEIKPQQDSVIAQEGMKCFKVIARVPLDYASTLKSDSPGSYMLMELGLTILYSWRPYRPLHRTVCGIFGTQTCLRQLQTATQR